MLTDYINAAIKRATYEDLQEEGWYGHIEGFTGLWANGRSRDEAEQELRSALEDWILFGLVNGYPVPPIDGIDLMAVKKNVA